MSTLQKQALTNICACFYYELQNSIDDLDDTELKKIIDTPFYSHIINNDDLTDCPDWKGGTHENQNQER